VVDEGTADVVRGGDVIASLGPGDFFGEMAMMGDGRRVADVVASSPITLFEMFGTHFRELEMRMPQVAATITATLEVRRSALCSRLPFAARQRSSEPISRDTGWLHGVGGPKGTLFELPWESASASPRL
jgi:CRP-like cAMP-binding protein